MKNVGEIGQTAPRGRQVEKMQRRYTHLFNRKLLQLRQRAGQQPHQEGSGTANNIQHGTWQHGDERVLPGEGVEQRHHCMHAVGQGTNDGKQKKRRKKETHAISYLHTHKTMPCRGHTRLNWATKQGRCFYFQTERGVVVYIASTFSFKILPTAVTNLCRVQKSIIAP